VAKARKTGGLSYDDARAALETYLKKRSSKARRCSSCRGPLRRKPISLRGIQKRMEYMRAKWVNVSCHRLRHTFATQLLNAGRRPGTIQDLLAMRTLPRPSATAGQRTSKCNGTITRRWRLSCNDAEHGYDNGKQKRGHRSVVAVRRTSILSATRGMLTTAEVSRWQRQRRSQGWPV